ncbi:MAG TPA: class I SAM-dependent methyltransferase [Vicinamibacterales bacterium]|nr:class I SAM-dependent methyltransferase [Vicinamibacterales bacterium]
MVEVTSTSCETAVPADRLRAIKARQQATWASGDYAVIGATLQIVGEQLAEAADIRSVHSVLDVAAGNGNATLAAARRFADVTSTDYVPALLARGRQRAEADGFGNIRFEIADVEALPYADNSFDVVLSTFGVMFAPDHARAASEMTRVCKPGGRIGLACWTPTGFVGELLKAVTRYTPPPAGVQPSTLWGTEDYLRRLFPRAAHLAVQPRFFMFRYKSAEHWVDMFRNFYGPTHMAFNAIDAEAQARLEADLISLLRSYDAGEGVGLLVPGEYLEAVVTK